MKIQQWQLISGHWKNDFTTTGFNAKEKLLVLAFGSPELVTDPSVLTHLRSSFPDSEIVISSTAGEISLSDVSDDTMIVTAIAFEKTRFRSVATNIREHGNSHDAGKFLMNELTAPDLAAVFVISDGTFVNGSELVTGFNENNSTMIPVTGGLAADGARFSKTFVGLNRAPEQGVVIAVGLYGSSISVGHGYFGGWDEFGPERNITRSDKNILYEISGKNALDLYKEYLGPYQDELPGSALLFPLSLKMPGTGEQLVRTILSINEQDKSMTFAGNMPQGSTVRLMKANFDRLIDSSSVAAKSSLIPLNNKKPELALLVSCVGRKLVLQNRIDEEVQAAGEIFGQGIPMAGFYSYGEISPLGPLSKCELHNQTMTITTFSEA